MSALKVIDVENPHKNLRNYMFLLGRKRLRVRVERTSKNQVHIEVKNDGDWITRELRVALEQAVTEHEQSIAFDPNAD
jgi:uncharacterized protein (UPF0218 family)